MAKRITTDGRRIDYLQIKLTDACNLRCVFCREISEKEKILGDEGDGKHLSFEEILQVVRIFAEGGGSRVHIIGGEPLLRQDLPLLVGETSQVKGIEDITLTTNGLLLTDKAHDLVKHGLTHLVVGIDSLQPERYERMTRGDHLFRVLSGLRALEKEGFSRIRICMVVIRGFNDDEVIDFALLTKKKPYQIRFVEYVPPSHRAEDETYRGYVHPIDEIKEELSGFQGLVKVGRPKNGGPIRIFRFKDGIGQISFVNPLTPHRCADCNRLALTPEGSLKGCLLDEAMIDVGPLLKNGGNKRAIRNKMAHAVRNKPERREIKNHVFKKCARTPY